MARAQRQIGGGILRLHAVQRWSVLPLEDVLVVAKALDKTESRKRKIELDRMAAMLSRLGGRGYQVGENSGVCESTKNDFDPDPDSDSEPAPS